MIQFNLLPDVKQKYIKTARIKRTVIVVSILVAVSSLAIFVTLFLSVRVFQKIRISSMNDSIKENTKKLEDKKDLGKVLTIQNQLNSLPALHDAKPVATRLAGFMSQITPAEISIGKLDVNYAENKMEVTGSTNSFAAINKYVDTIKFTKYGTIGDDNIVTLSDNKPFNDVVMASFSRDEKETTYTISFNFNPEIFDSKLKIKLDVPKQTTTRSDIEKPQDLFKALPEKQI